MQQATNNRSNSNATFNFNIKQIIKGIVGLGLLTGCAALGSFIWNSFSGGTKSASSNDLVESHDKSVLVADANKFHAKNVAVAMGETSQLFSDAALNHNQLEAQLGEEIAADSDLIYREPTELESGFVAVGNAELSIVNNHLKIGQGQTLPLTLAMLQVTYNGDLSKINYFANNMQRGRFEFVYNQGVAIAQFSEVQVANGQVQLVHDNSLFAPQYEIIATDGDIYTAPQNVTVDFVLAAILWNNYLNIGQGREIILTTHELNATNIGVDPLTLVFQSQNILHGRFVSLQTNSEVDEFSQAAVVNGDVKFIQDNTIIPPSYQIRVYNGLIATSYLDVQTTFHLAPIITSHQITVNQGQTVQLNALNFNVATSANSSSPLFILSNVLHGFFSRVLNPNAAINNFTLSQIINKEVEFTHDNTQWEPSGLVVVADDYCLSTSSVMQFNFDISPVIVANQLSITQGGSVTFSNSMLSATDLDANLDDLIFIITNIQNGYFIVVGVNTNLTSVIFSQKAIVDGKVTFFHDDSFLPPSYEVAVTDTVMTTTATTALITFFPKAIDDSNNTYKNALISGGVVGGLGLLVWLFRKYNDWINAKAFSRDNFKDLVCLALLARIKISGFRNFMSEKLRNSFKDAVEQLLSEIKILMPNLLSDNLSGTDRQRIINEIVRQTKDYLTPKDVCCYKGLRLFKNFFVAEFSPEQIESGAARIAKAIKLTFFGHRVSQSAIDVQVQIGNNFNTNPLYKYKSEMFYGSGSSSSSSSSSCAVKANEIGKLWGKVDMEKLGNQAEQLVFEVNSFFTKSSSS